MTGRPSSAVAPSASQDRILTEHAYLRDLLRALTDGASRVGAGLGVHVLLRVVGRLEIALARHQRLQSEVCTDLRQRSPNGSVLADHVEAMHRYQAEWLRELRAAVAAGRSGLEIAVRASALAQVLGDDLDQEERWLAHLVGIAPPAPPVAQVA